MSMKKTLGTLAASIAAVALAGSAGAATIVYSFETTTAAMNGSNTGQTATVAVSTNDFGSGVTAGNYSAVSPTGGIQSVGGQMRALKKSDTDTHTFTVTIPANVNIKFTNLFFDYGKTGGDNSPANFLVTSNFAGGTFTPNTATHATVTTNVATSVNMVMAGTFANILSASPTVITFTLADSAAGNNNSTSMYTWIDNVTLTGEVIPEPASAMLAGLGGLLMLWRRRRA